MQPARAVSIGGNLAATSDYIYRGYSATHNTPAAQIDLHLSSQSGTFAGIWASSLDRNHGTYADLEVQEYVGQRFNFGAAWNATVTLSNDSYLGGQQYYSSDYQEISASVSYLDRWTLSVSAIPNAVRYSAKYPAGRYPAYAAEASGQWLIAHGLFVTAGLGYYLITGESSEAQRLPDIGYGYGSVGLAYEWRNWRLDVGYFLTEERVPRLFPYPVANHRVAGTLSWRF